LDQGLIRLKARIVSSNLMRCFRLCFRCVQATNSTRFLYRSAAFDVLANFLRLSFLAFRVNHFLQLSFRLNPESFGKVFCLEEAEVLCRQLRYCAKFQNTATTHKTPRSLGFYIYCSNLGLESVGSKALTPSNAWTALRLALALFLIGSARSCLQLV
jgi:hypothetical protein